MYGNMDMVEVSAWGMRREGKGGCGGERSTLEKITGFSRGMVLKCERVGVGQRHFWGLEWSEKEERGVAEDVKR